MKRFKEYNPDQNYLISFDSQEAFPPGSFEHFIIVILDQIVDENDFYPEEKDEGGPEAHNPKAILGVLFYGYSKAIYSYRKMAAACLYNIAFVYLSGYSTPDHSTISRFVTRFKDKIIDLFSMILYVAAKQGFIDYKMTATDGTKMIANASSMWSGTIEDFQKRKTKLENRIKDVIERSDRAKDAEAKGYWAKKGARLEKQKNKIANFLQQANKITKKDEKEIKQNITDNDSRTMKIDGNGYKPGYNVQATVCGKHGIIVGADVTDQANDIQQLQPMLEKTKKSALETCKENFNNGKHLADSGYDSVDNALYADKNQLDLYIPPGTTKELFEKKPVSKKKINWNKRMSGREKWS